ncbi:hypothetical protein [Nocardioides flavescens]|uniref:Uncharacterized protein n=1 Tax=Nocardioides flavescens TaxID=2691959 RepID=A0A6L7F217_9ACTN|nr:hypothetical protein [Nocardioides flavescens]MXG90672.1 hypothetical protein [Nocardioides flavescens]
MVRSRVGVVAIVVLVAVPGVLASSLIHDTSGAHLELAPLFLAAGVAAVTVWRHRLLVRARR